MTRLLTEGFESGNQSVFVLTNAAISTTQKKTGAYSLEASGGGALVTLPAMSEFYFKAYIYRKQPYSDQTILSWLTDTTVMGSVKLQSNTGLVRFYVENTLTETTQFYVANDTWYLFEVHVKIDDSVGVIEVKVNGILNSSEQYSGDTKPSTGTTINTLKIEGADYGPIYFDDIAINDTAGAVDNSWCGDGRVIALTPDGVGDASELTPSSGSVNYLMVDEVPNDGDTTYVSGSVGGLKDLYNFTPTGLDSGSHVILRAFVETITKDTSGSTPFATIIQSGSSLVEEASQYTSLSYALYKGTDNYLNPATGLAWTIDELDAIQAGIMLKE